MPDITGQPAEIRMTLQITRAATGKTETVELVGHVVPQQSTEQPTQEPEHGDDSQHRSA